MLLRSRDHNNVKEKLTKKLVIYILRKRKTTMSDNKSFQEFSDLDTLIGGNNSRVARMLAIIAEGEYTGAYVGTNGNDTLQASGIIFGLQGNDALGGESSSDTIFGGKDDDNVFGGDGNDFLRGDQGNDTVIGGDGNDTIHGGKGDDLISGGLGSDTLCGDQGSDTIFADSSDLIRITGDEGDLLYVEIGTRVIGFREGLDTLSGGNFRLENGVVVQITAPTPVPTPSPAPSPFPTVPVIPVIPPISVRVIPTPVIPSGVKIGSRNSSLSASQGDDTLTGSGNTTLVGAMNDKDNFLLNTNTAADSDRIRGLEKNDSILIPSNFQGKVRVYTDERFPGLAVITSSVKVFTSIELGSLTVGDVESIIRYI